MKYRNHYGQSLIEVMVALTISLFLLSILTIAFQAARITAQYVDDLIQIQEAVILFFHLLRQDLDQPNAQILNPEQIPQTISQRIEKNTDGLLIETSKQQIAYFVSKTNKSAALHRKNLTESAHIQDGLAINIKNLQIKYGVLITNTLEFLPATQVTNWNKVKLIKVQVLIKSEHAVLNHKPLIKDLSFIVGVK